jgi:hypothetical protein
MYRRLVGRRGPQAARDGTCQRITLIVPSPTAESKAADWLNQGCDGMRTGCAYDVFEGIQRVFNQRE